MALGQFLFGGAISGGIGALMMKRSWHSFDARTCCKNCYGNAYITYIHNIYIYMTYVFYFIYQRYLMYKIRLYIFVLHIYTYLDGT